MSAPRQYDNADALTLAFAIQALAAQAGELTKAKEVIARLSAESAHYRALYAMTISRLGAMAQQAEIEGRKPL